MGEGKAKEIEPGVPEKRFSTLPYSRSSEDLLEQFAKDPAVQHFQPLDERPPLMDAEGALPEARLSRADYGKMQEAEAARLRSLYYGPPTRPRETPEHYKAALYSISSALHLSSMLLSNERNRTPVGGAAWDILSQLAQKVNAIREQVVGLLEEKVEEVR